MMTNIDVKIRNPYNNCILRKIIYHQYLPMLIGISDQMGAQTDRLRCEVCQNLILSPMNTVPLRPAVATAPTVYGIETTTYHTLRVLLIPLLQQHLPFTVLKLINFIIIDHIIFLSLQQHLPFTVLKLQSLPLKQTHHNVATAPTVYGIETNISLLIVSPPVLVATAPTVYGIETTKPNMLYCILFQVATAPTVYGIETKLL